MSKTTIQRGNILAGSLAQAALPSTTVPTDSTIEATITVPNVDTSLAVFASFAGTQTTGIGIGNAYVKSSNTVAIQLFNVTGANATTATGNVNLYIVRCEDSPIPSAIV